MTTTEPGTGTASGPRGGEIRCRDLVRIFATDGVEVQALQGLNLTIEEGEIVAVVGASGSGKSTLLTILSGLDTPTGGAARVAGTDLLAMGPRERVAYQRHTVGFVWQATSRNLLPYLTARDNVLLPLELAGSGRRRAARGVAASGSERVLGRADKARRVEDLLDLLEVADVADRRPAQLSGGQQQRVAIAVAMANSPRVLLADEPTGELDEGTSAEVLEAMREVNRATGVTTLIVTHDPTVSEHVARTVQIRDGRTSTETLRRTEVDEHGTERSVAEEFAVLDRVGRLQLPEDFTSALGLKDRVRLTLEPDHAGVWPAASDREPGPTSRVSEDQEGSER